MNNIIGNRINFRPGLGGTEGICCIMELTISFWFISISPTNQEPMNQRAPLIRRVIRPYPLICNEIAKNLGFFFGVVFSVDFFERSFQPTAIDASAIPFSANLNFNLFFFSPNRFIERSLGDESPKTIYLFLK